MFRSLTAKIIFLVCSIIFATSALAIYFTHRDVKQAMFEAEQNSIGNVLYLVELNIQAGYRNLLRSRMDAVVSHRRNLRSISVSARNGLAEILRPAGSAPKPHDQEVLRALEWLRSFSSEKGTQLIVFNGQGTVLAHPDSAVRDQNLHAVSDLRGISLVDSVQLTIQRTGEAYSTFLWPWSGQDNPVQKVGYFVPYPPLGWYIGAFMSIEELELQGERKRAELLDDLRAKFAQTRIADTGFLILFNTHGELLIQPRGMRQRLLDRVNANSGRPVMYDLRALAETRSRDSIRVSVPVDAGHVHDLVAYYTHIRPMGWYVAALVPVDEVLEPAKSVVANLSLIFGVMLLLSLAVALALATRITRPLNALARYAKTLPESDFTSEPDPHVTISAQLPKQGFDEVGRLADALAYMERVLREEISTLIKTTAANERLAGELTERKRTERELTLQNRFQELLVEISADYLGLDLEQVDDAVESSLAKLGLFIKADRAYVFIYDFDREICTNTHEWCAETIDPQIDQLQAVPLSAVPEVVQVHRRGEHFLVPDVAELPVDSRLRRHLLDMQGIQSVFIAPLMDANQCLGFVGFDFFRERHAFTLTEQRLLAFFAYMLVNTFKRKDMETALQHSCRQAEAANLAKSRFLANMSHEIRTPMNAVLGFAEILERDPALNPEQVSHVRRILSSGEHLLRLINDILDMSRIEAGQVELHQEDFGLFDLISDMESMFRANAKAKGLNLLLELNEVLPPAIHADQGKLRQILVNLLGNAVKFTQAGQIILRVNSEPLPDKDPQNHDRFRLVIEVEDTGPGIAEHDLDRLFDHFFQAAKGVEHTGTGLGMSISRGYARLMGGDLTATSKLGRGSCFRLAVPVWISQGDIRSRDERKQVSGLMPETGSWRILAVDDKPDNLTLLTSLLRPVGFEVREATNGIEALDVFAKWSPHAVLLDMRMPSMDGYEAARRIKATEAGRDTLVVAVTAGAFEDSRQKVMAAGVDAYLAKPFQARELFDILAQGLGVRYVYQDRPNPPAMSHPPSLAPESRPGFDPGLSPAASSATPPSFSRETIEAVLQAAEKGDIVSLLHLTEQAGQEDAQAARILRGLADAFDYNAIAAWLGRS